MAAVARCPVALELTPARRGLRPSFTEVNIVSSQNSTNVAALLRDNKIPESEQTPAFIAFLESTTPENAAAVVKTMARSVGTVKPAGVLSGTANLRENQERQSQQNVESFKRFMQTALAWFDAAQAAWRKISAAELSALQAEELDLACKMGLVERCVTVEFFASDGSMLNEAVRLCGYFEREAFAPNTRRKPAQMIRLAACGEKVKRLILGGQPLSPQIVLDVVSNAHRINEPFDDSGILPNCESLVLPPQPSIVLQWLRPGTARTESVEQTENAAKVDIEAVKVWCNATLKSGEHTALMLICDAGGSSALADLNVRLDWGGDSDACAGSLQKRLNKKLAVSSLGYAIERHNNALRLVRRESLNLRKSPK
ncbi:MAG: hypothetical protein QM775_27850 [Pirellulales bacterium]